MAKRRAGCVLWVAVYYLLFFAAAMLLTNFQARASLTFDTVYYGRLSQLVTGLLFFAAGILLCLLPRLLAAGKAGAAVPAFLIIGLPSLFMVCLHGVYLMGWLNASTSVALLLANHINLFLAAGALALANEAVCLFRAARKPAGSGAQKIPEKTECSQ